jgi:ribulose-phosphate 3-epimerase
MSALISPSILSADFCNLESELSSIGESDLIHVDVMDGHFVPNLTLGLPVVKRINEVSSVPLDVHLMIEDPERWAPQYGQLGCHSVTFHYEAASDATSVITAIRETGAKVGIAIKPATPVSAIRELVSTVDMVLVMTVEPGFGGQLLIEKTISKVSEVRDLIGDSNTLLQVDGGITAKNIQRLAAAGANTFVAGTEIFTSADRNAKIRELRDLAITL